MRHFSSLLAALLTAGATWAQSGAPLDLATATIADLNAAFVNGTLTAEALTGMYLDRIAAYDKQGPMINAVIALNPRALDEARALDAERKAGRVRGPLHGIPIILKDNFNTRDLPTTGGSQLLEGSIPPADAFVVTKLRQAGAIVLAKTNLSEFASGGGSVIGAKDPAVLKAGQITDGFSSLGGQTRNPHDPSRGPGSSSGGSGAAVAAVFAQFGLGTDTAGSIRGPSAANGVVGLKTTRGLVSRTGLLPLANYDTVGPIARSVYDVAVVLNVLAGLDPSDPSTRRSAGRLPKDYTEFVRAGALRGARIGIGRDFTGPDPETIRITEQAIATLKQLGAVIVDPVGFPDHLLQMKQPVFTLVRNSEFKALIARYLATLKPGYPRTLEGLIAKAEDPKTAYRSPEKLVGLKYTNAVALAMDDPVYLAAKNEGYQAVTAGVEAIFEKYQLDALLYPSANRPAVLLARPPEPPPAGPIPGGESASLFADETGFPDIIVPAGMTNEGLPVTISFMGRPFSEPRLLGFAYDFEQATHARVLPRHTPPLR
jgi:amidase